MAIVFAVRGDSFNARYSNGGAQGDKINSAKISTASAGLSGTVWDLTDTTQVKLVVFRGALNTPNTRVHSIIARIAPGYTGTPTGSRSIWSLSTGVGTSSAYLELRHDITTGNLTIVGKNELSSTFVSGSFGSWSPTSGTFYDIVVMFDGTTTASNVKCYVDNSQIGTGLTASNALSSSWTNRFWQTIAIGSAPNTLASAFKLDEFVIDDTQIDPNSYPLVGGNGALNGASRTNLINSTAFDGLSYSDPGIANVKTGTAYTYAGNSQTGTYDGSDRWSDPGVANVLSGVSYKANSTTNNRTGTLVSSSGAQLVTAIHRRI